MTIVGKREYTGRMGLSTAPHRVGLALWLAFCCGGVISGSGCASHQDAEPAGESSILQNVALSAELQSSVAAGRTMLATTPEPAPSEDLFASRRDLELRIQRPASRAAAREDLFELWSRDPENLIWIDLAHQYRYLLGSADTFTAMAASAELSDSTTIAGSFLLGCKNEYVGRGGPQFRHTAEHWAELDATAQTWLSLKLARVEAQSGQALESVRRLQSILPHAQSSGGHRLSAEVWRQLAAGLLIADRLDDALHAANLAADFAERAGDGYGALMARVLVGEVLAARREHAAAWQVWDSCIAAAKQSDYPWPTTKALNLAAGLALDLADPSSALRYDLRLLDLRFESRDSLNVPRVMVNVAYDYRLLGEPDSSLVVLQRARRWIDAYKNRANLARMPLFEAEHWCFVGSYARAESLLAVAGAEVPGQSFPHEEASFLVSQARVGMESGLPELAYRSVERLRVLQNKFYDTTPEQNLRADLELLSANLLTQQGEFRRASAALDRARIEIDARSGPSKEWDYHRFAGELAFLRGDLRRARVAFETCLELASDRGDRDQAIESQFRLGGVLLEQSDFESARRLVQPVETDSQYGGRFRTRLSSQVFLGMIFAREGRFEDARTQLEAALTNASERTPQDLMALLKTELGRTMIGLGDHGAASRLLHQALENLDELGGRKHISELRAMAAAPRREATEILIGLLHDQPQLMEGRDLAESTLELARACRTAVAEGRDFARPEGPTLVFFVGRNRSYQWTCLGGEWALRSLPGGEVLRSLVDPVVFDTSAPGRTMDLAAAARLSDLLLEPIANDDAWPAGSVLKIVGDDVLAAVPWCVLPWQDGKTLIDHGPICEAPDLSFWLDATSVTAREQLPLLSVGTDGTAGESTAEVQERTDSLHLAEEEARRVAALWPSDRITLRLGDTASWPELQSLNLGSFGVIHVASHAVLHQGLPQRSTLRLAGGDGADPLTMSVVRDLSLDAQLIYLSCCEAARPVGRGDSLDDFAGAFLQAGARTVVASRLKVDDAASAFLAEQFYRHWLEGTSAAQALRSAQLELRAARPEWQHPFYWASYRVIGDGS